MKLKPYPKYKDSKVQWIGEIPEEWKVQRGKFQFKVTGGYAFPSEDFVEEGISLVRIGDVSEGTVDLENCKKLPEEYSLTKKDFLLKEKEVLVAMTGATIGKVGQVPKTEEKMLLNQRVGRIKTKYSSDFYKYVLTADFIKEQIRLIAEGAAQENISSEQIESFVIPQLDEKNQKYISSFLDSKTSQLDQTIEKDKQLIELLKEKRIALINHVVTKGLDKNAKMKDSGIDWIGEIPEHWSTRRIDKLSKVSRGASPRPIDDPIYFDENGEYSWVRIADVSSSDRYLEESSEKLSVLGKSLSVALEPGRLFVSIAGTVGKPIITKIKCCIHDGFVYFKNMKVNNEYLYYIFIGERAYLGLGKWGTQLNLNTETIGLITIPLPDDKEQIKIVEYLDKETSKIDQIIKKIEEKINLMEEYKKSLIHHVVTGKVDVRGEV
jgi:type I restriction enzyme, S subunit